MREIRFRAWCGTEKEMVSHEKLIYDPDDWFIGLLRNEDTKDSLMQYTGLKDKNGKEIYEGDILDSKYKWEVYFSLGCFWVRRNKVEVETVQTIIHKRQRAAVPVEIIGNIYENPELLNTLSPQAEEAVNRLLTQTSLQEDDDWKDTENTLSPQSRSQEIDVAEAIERYRAKHRLD